VVVISGGSRGLGGALVEGMLAEGAVVATYSRAASELIERLRRADPEAERFFWREVDGTDGTQVTEFGGEVARRFGRVDVLVNNAAALVEEVLALTRPADIGRLIALNVESAILLTRACTRAMLLQGQGVVVNISSLNGIRGFKGVSVYSATKAALDGFTRSLARELGPRGIRVNSVAPGYFASEMAESFAAAQQAAVIRRTPLRRLGKVEDMVGAVRFLASSEASFITGQTLVVDGGLTC
jgi:3-oxoacyl-[acyl-carrier protein] reductase